jgi:hypothetical protein
VQQMRNILSPPILPTGRIRKRENNATSRCAR